MKTLFFEFTKKREVCNQWYGRRLIEHGFTSPPTQYRLYGFPLIHQSSKHRQPAVKHAQQHLVDGKPWGLFPAGTPPGPGNGLPRVIWIVGTGQWEQRSQECNSPLLID